MPQTLLALFAVMLTSMFALQQSRQALKTQMTAVHRETQTQARGVASEVFAQIATFAFDENTENADGPVPVTSMTPEPFATGKDFTDTTAVFAVEHVHGMLPYHVERAVTSPSGEQATLTFEVTATVDYADFATSGGEEVMQPTPGNQRSYYKLVALSVRCLDLENTPWGSDLFRLRLARPFSYSPTEF